MIEDPDYVNCAPVTWTLTNADGTPLDATIFSNVVLSNAGCSVDIQTNDPFKAGIYDLVVKAVFDTYPNNFQEKFFQIEITDTCEISPNFALNTIISDFSHGLGIASLSKVFTAFTPTPAYCPIPSYVFFVTPAPSDTAAIVYTAASLQFDFFTEDRLMIGPWLVEVFGTTP